VNPPHPRFLGALRRLWLTGFAAAPELDEQLTAMAWYLDLFREWRPEPTRCPVFLLRPTDALPDDEPPAPYAWRSTWDTEHVAVDLPGDHATLLSTHAETTARAVHEVLAVISDQPS
jgi:polyketide synthase 12